MEDLIPRQIRDSCKLALPDGLNELMSDITREVLRYQPSNLYEFIANYLSAMLITRDNLSIAGYICSDISHCSCEPELHTELRDMGFREDDIQTARDIIVSYLEKGKVDEGNLMMKLIKSMDIDKHLLPAIQEAIRAAFLRHQAHNTTKYESSSSSEHDVTMCAARHTLELYRKTAPNKETYDIMAEKIQKSYRAYGLKRDSKPKNKTKKISDKFVTLVDPKLRPQPSNSYDIAFPNTTLTEEPTSAKSSIVDLEIQMSACLNKKRITTISSTSLAGSFMALPTHKPYSAHDSDVLSDLDEYPEREHAHIDYTADDPHVSMVIDDKLFYQKMHKKISFNEEAIRMGLEAADDDDSLSKDSLPNDSMKGADSDTFYHGDVMRIDGNYDGDTETESSDINVSRSESHSS